MRPSSINNLHKKSLIVAYETGQGKVQRRMIAGADKVCYDAILMIVKEEAAP